MPLRRRATARARRARPGCRPSFARRGRCGRGPRRETRRSRRPRSARGRAAARSRAGGRAARRSSRRRRSVSGRSAIAASSASSRSVASFSAGCRLDARARRLDGGEPFGRDRVEVADREVDVQAELERPVDAAVGGDHGRAVGQLAVGPAEGMPSGNDDNGFGLHAHTSAGITQIRFCGSVARQPPSQPGRARAPRFAAAILALTGGSRRRASRAARRRSPAARRDAARATRAAAMSALLSPATLPRRRSPTASFLT